MRFACWITKAANTHSEYVILTALPQQQWLRERASVLGTRTLPTLLSYQHLYLQQGRSTKLRP
jgi:hypothetical protein